MRHASKRLIALLLTVVLLFSMLPRAVQAEDVSGNGLEALSSVYLPIVEEGAEAAGLFQNGAKYYYASTSAMSIRLNDVTVPSEGSASLQNARVQAVNGDTVVAQSEQSTIYNYNGGYHVSTELFFLVQPAVGDYELQVVYGDAENMTTLAIPDLFLSVVDAPVITYAGIQNLYMGAAPFSLTIRVSGYQGNPNLYTFGLMNGEGTEIPCTATYKSLSNFGSEVQITYTVTPSQALAEDVYALVISANSVYSNADSVSASVTETAPETLTISGVTANAAVTGGVTVVVDDATEGAEYRVKAEYVQHGSTVIATLYEGVLMPVMDGTQGTFSFVLQYNGVTLPLSSYSYLNESIVFTVTNESGGTDRFECEFAQGNSNVRSELEITQTGTCQYEFKLTGENMLLDVYAGENNVFEIKKDETTLATCMAVTKSTVTQQDTVYCYFTGSFTTASELDSTKYYDFYINGELHTSVKVKLPVASDVLQVKKIKTEFGWSSFSFNFDCLTAEVLATNGAGTATMELCDANQTVVATSGEVAGTATSDGYCYRLTLQKPAEFDENGTYTLRIRSGEKTHWVEGTNGKTFDSTVRAPYSYNVDTPVFAGDSRLVIGLSSPKNISLEYYEANPFSFLRTGADTGLSYTLGTPYYSFEEAEWKLPLELSEPLAYGTYEYDYYSFTTQGSGTPVLADWCTTDDVNRVITIEGNRNLPEASYTGALFVNEGDGGKVADVALSKDGDVLTVTNLPEGIENGSYMLEVFADSQYIGAVSCYIRWNVNTAVPTIKAYDSEHSYTEIQYEIIGNNVWFDAALTGYAYVRFSEDALFADTQYQAIRNKIPFLLSDGEGEKTVYVQFKKAGGEESEVYRWQCKMLEEAVTPEILSVDVLVNGSSSMFVPEYTEFVLRLVTNSALTSAYATFILEDGTLSYTDAELDYVESTQEGVVYEAVLNTGSYPFSNEAYYGVEFAITDMSGYQMNPYDTERISVLIGAEGLLLKDWESESKLYKNTGAYTVSGYGIPGAEVTIQLYNANVGFKTEVVTVSSSGEFSAEFTGLGEHTYEVTVTDDAGNDIWKDLVIDKTAPVISGFKATLDQSGNAAVSWECEEENLKGFILWRDGAKIIDEYNNFTDTSYIVSYATGAVFELQAVDKAGNYSEKVQTSTQDTEAPTAPGVPFVTAHGTKKISFSWTAATDNVAVYRYEVYRGETKLATLPYTALSYSDSGLLLGTEYEYHVYALDRAGNKSEATSATLATAGLEIASVKNFEEKYYLEAYMDTKRLPVHLNLEEDALYDFSGVTTKILYKLENAQSWAEEAMTGSGTYYSGSWTIDGLEPGMYQVKFKVSDAEGSENFSEVQTVKILHDDINPEVTVSLPEEGRIYAGKEMEISGNATDNLVLKTVELYVSADEGASYTKIATETNPHITDRLSYNVSYEEAKDFPSGSLWFKAVAVDSAGNKAEVIRKIVLDNTPPDGPENFWVGGDKEKITVMWSYPELAPENDFSHFNVYRSATGEDGSFAVVEEIGSIGYFDTLETGIVADTLYYYYVTAEDIYGNESEATLVQYAKLIDDTEAPVIRGIGPDEDSLIKSAELIVSATDNYRLDRCVIEYKKANASEWTSLAEVGCGDTPVRSYVYHYTWNLEGLEAGNYQVRFTVYDEQENEPATQICDYIIKEYTAPVAPVATAQSTGHKTITVSWTYAGNRELAESFSVYRSSDGVSYEYIGMVNVGNDWKYTDILRFEGDSKEFFYKVAVKDTYLATSESVAVSAVAKTADTEKPVAVFDMNSSAYALCGNEITFDAGGSTDNDNIAEYSWNFGDGKTAKGVSAAHAYTTPGTYTVQLTVKDATGNVGTTGKAVTIVATEQAKDYTKVEVVIKNALDNSMIAEADVIIVDNNGTETPLRAEAGTVTCLLPNGFYTVRVAAQGFLIRSVSITCEGGEAQHIIGLTNSEVMVGEFNVTEMTYDEIVAAGIDTEAEGNQHVYKFKTEITFVAGLKMYSLPLTLYKNNNGETVGKSGDGFFFFPLGTGGGTGGSGEGYGDIKLQIDFSEHFVLAIYGEAHWLKEMYHAQLTVMNQSYTDTLEQVSAKINLPEGLSLADMTGEPQEVYQHIGTIGHGESKKIDWYIRGDKEGEYHVSADVIAVSMPFGDVIEQRFSTKEPLKVYAGSALHLTITPDSTAERGEEYTVKFRLENVSDKSLYNLTFGITRSEQYKVLGWDVDSPKLELEATDYGDTFTKGIKELGPGGYIELTFSTTVWFNSALHLVELTKLGAFVDIAYYVTDVQVTTMEGSTTEIPYTININHKEPDSFINKIVDKVFEEAYEEFFDEEVHGLSFSDFVELWGKAEGLDVNVIKKATTLLKLAKGETNHKMFVTIDNGKIDGHRIYNDYISVTTGNGVEGIIDSINNTGVTISGTEFSIKVNAPGKTSFKVGIKDDYGNLESEYTLNYNIKDEEVKQTVTLTPEGTELSYQVNGDIWEDTIGKVRQEELEMLAMNPFMGFQSTVEYELSGSEGKNSYMVTIDDESINEMLGHTGVSHMGVMGGTSDVIFDRDALLEIADEADTDITLVARRLSEEEAKELGSDKPTYQYQIVCGDEMISNFGTGSVYVTVPYELTGTETADSMYVEHILPNGRIEKLDATYDADRKTISFSTNGFSYFRIVSETSESDTPGGNTPGGNTPGGNTPGGNTSGGTTPGWTPSLPPFDSGTTDDDTTEDKEDTKDKDDSKDKEDTEDKDDSKDKEDTGDKDDSKDKDDTEDKDDTKESGTSILVLTEKGTEEKEVTVKDAVKKYKKQSFHLFRYNKKEKSYEYVGSVEPKQLEKTIADSKDEVVVIVAGEMKTTEKVTYKTHTVKHGDTLWKISEKYLGKGNRYKEIMKLNNMESAVLYTGMKLKLPVEETVKEEVFLETEPSETTAITKNKTHTVKHGDTMWKIAEQYLGEGSRYKEIMKLNNMTSAMLRTGMVLELPIKETQTSVTEGKSISVADIIRDLNKQRKDGDAEEKPVIETEKPDAVKPEETKPQETKPAPAAKEEKKEEKKKTTKYKVKSGDYLRKIAQEQLGDGSRWTEIRDLNPNIKDINKIYPGQQLILPEK